MYRCLQRLIVPALIAGTLIATELRAQDEASATVQPEHGSVPVGIFLMEAVAFGSGLAARSETGARVVGAVHGLSGAVVLGIVASRSAHAGWPAFLVPYGIGLLGLSAYNFAAASSGTPGERFWTNAIGFNAAVAAGVLSAVIQRTELRSSRVSVQLGPSGSFVSIRF